MKELERVGRPVNPKDADIVIFSGPTFQFDAEFQMPKAHRNHLLESESEAPS